MATRDSVEKIQRISTVNNQVDKIVSDIVVKVGHQAGATREIAENMNQASWGIREMVENTAQISIASSEVAQEIAGVNDGANQIFASSSQVLGNAEEIKQMAETLKAGIGWFTV